MGRFPSGMEGLSWLRGGGLNSRSLVVPPAAASYKTYSNSVPAGNLFWASLPHALRVFARRHDEAIQANRFHQVMV